MQMAPCGRCNGIVPAGRTPRESRNGPTTINGDPTTLHLVRTLLDRASCAGETGTFEDTAGPRRDERIDEYENEWRDEQAGPVASLVAYRPAS